MAYNKREAKAKKKRQEWEDHTERRLRDNFDVYSEKLTANLQGLLEKDRTGNEQNSLTEKQLEGEHSDTRHVITEKRMDTESAQFGNVMRKDLDSGQVPPLEAKRLSDNPVEKTKYSPANKAPKKRPE